MGKVEALLNEEIILEVAEGQTGRVDIAGTDVFVEVRQHQENNGLVAYTAGNPLGRHSTIGVNRSHQLDDTLKGLRIHHERG